MEPTATIMSPALTVLPALTSGCRIMPVTLLLPKPLRRYQSPLVREMLSRAFPVDHQRRLSPSREQMSSTVRGFISLTMTACEPGNILQVANRKVVSKILEQLLEDPSSRTRSSSFSATTTHHKMLQVCVQMTPSLQLTSAGAISVPMTHRFLILTLATKTEPGGFLS